MELEVRVEAMRMRRFRSHLGDVWKLADSMMIEGQHHPVILWRDNTVISGERRVHAALMAGKDSLKVEYVSTIEEAAAALIKQNSDNATHSKAMLWSEVASLWELLRELDKPAALRRADSNRRRGVKLRRQVQAGRREPGRGPKEGGEEYFLKVVTPPFDISAASARRILSIYRGAVSTDPEQKDRAAFAWELMADIDANGNIWANYQRWQGVRSLPPTAANKQPATKPAAAEKQVAAFVKAAATMSGVMDGLAALGPVHSSLTWEQVASSCAQFARVRRELEKLIKQMRETAG